MFVLQSDSLAQSVVRAVRRDTHPCEFDWSTQPRAESQRELGRGAAKYANVYDLAGHSHRIPANAIPRITHPTALYPETRFGGFTPVLMALSPSTQMCQCAPSSRRQRAGRGLRTRPGVHSRRRLRSARQRCWGDWTDRDRRVDNNLYKNEFRDVHSSCWPVDDGSTDVCLADHVLEHVQSPGSVLAECGRVVKPGGFLCIRTPQPAGVRHLGFPHAPKLVTYASAARRPARATRAGCLPYLLSLQHPKSS